MTTQREVTISFNTKNGNIIKGTFYVKDGSSTFDLWLALPANKGKTIQQFFDESIGNPGVGFDKVRLIKDDFDSETLIHTLKLDFILTDQSILTGDFQVNDGEDALNFYKVVSKNPDATQEDFLKYLKGVTGDGIINVTGELIEQ